jgi:GTP-binding protein
MRPVIALVGRPNVGKSTLFNQLTRSRDALVADFAGLTRDRKYGIGRLGGDYIVIDTGGLTDEKAQLDQLMMKQTQRSVEEADHIIWMLDGRQGITAGDEVIARDLRQSGKSVTLAVNKTEGLDADQALSEFYRFGFSKVFAIAAVHGRGLGALIKDVLAKSTAIEGADTSSSPDFPGIRIAFVGRPNVGKSTLLNRILGEERVVVSDVPGTTRDSIFVPFERDGQDYVLIDTAGVRRRARVHEAVEKFSVVKTLDAIERADVVINVLDAQAGITEQDVHLIGLTLEAGRAVIVVLNKWDHIDPETREQILHDYTRKLTFLDFTERYTISALHGTGVGLLYPAVQRAYKASRIDVPTTRLTKLLEVAVNRHQPPLVKGRRIKLRYAHQGGKRPPVFVIHGNQTERIPGAYKRYLNNYFRDKLKLVGTPVRLEFKTGKNPYATKKKPRNTFVVKKSARATHRR